MSLVFSAITPHPPLAIPTIDDVNIEKIQSTIKAFQNLEGELYVSQPDVIFIISPHSPMTSEAFSLNLANKFKSNLAEFGYSQKELRLKCDLEIVSKIKEEADDKKIPVNMANHENMDHGLSVPLFYLTKHLPEIKIVPISFSLLSLEKHYKFGKILRRVINNTNKRVAVISSADLSHRLTKKAPAGYSPEAKTFDNLLIKFLEENKIQDILKINPKLIKEAGECGLRSIAILLGILNGSNYKFKKLSYEGPFGVGYLVGEFVF